MKKQNKTIKGFKGFFAMAIISIQIFGVPLLTYGQTSNSVINDYNDDWINSYLDDSVESSVDRLGLGTTDDDVNDSLFESRGYDPDNMNPLYPVKDPNNVSVEDISVEFVSCISSLYLTSASKVAMYTVQQVISSVGQLVGDFVDGLNGWMAGLASFAGMEYAMERTVDDAERVEKQGITMGGVLVLPSDEQIAFCAKNMLIAYLSATIVKWVNEGFNDAAVFVESLESKLNDVTNIAFEEAIGEVNVCGYLEAKVELSAVTSMLKTKPKAPPNRCTFVFDNRAKLMLEGKVFDYDSFEDMYLNPNHNAIGAYLAVDSVFMKKNEQYRDNFKEELGWYDGVLPWKDPESGRTITPGHFVSEKIMKSLGSNMDTLNFSDGWDEVMFILYNQIIKTNLSEALSI